MHRTVDEAAAAAAEEPELPVGIEPSVADPAPPHDVPPRDAIAVARIGCLQHGDDLLAQRRLHLLVGIQRQDPVTGGVLDPEVLLRGEALPGVNHHVIRELACERDRLVLRPRVDHDDLIRPRHAGERLANAVLLVQRDDDDGKPRRGHAASTSAVAAAAASAGGIEAIRPSALWSTRCPGPYGPFRTPDVGP